jgi:hypothetical protein
MSASKYGKYVVTDLKMPEARRRIDEEYTRYATRILWMDSDVVPGAFHIKTSWFLAAEAVLEDKSHTHTYDEIIGFFGNDAENPWDLGAEVEIWLEDEIQIITKSTLIFIPAGMVHCPMIVKRVDRPVFHFTVVPAGHYIKEEK